MPTAGYSGTPLAKKLGIKEGFLLRIINAPAHYLTMLPHLPPGVQAVEETHSKKDLIHLFVTRALTCTSLFSS